MQVTDFTLSAAAILTSLINYDNGTTLAPGQLSFGTPVCVQGSTTSTQVVMTAVAGSGYLGSVAINYNRVDLRTVPGQRNTIFPLGDAVRVSDMLPQINAAYGINLAAADIVDGPLPALSGTPVNGIYPPQVISFSLVMQPSNLIFVNQLVLSLSNSLQIPLNTVITMTALNGLVYTQPG